MEIIKLNLIPSGVNPICHAKQYDKGRIIRFELFNGLTPYTLQSGDTVTLNLRKPDNTIIESSVTATQGNKYVDLVTTEQICAVAGFNLGTFKITNGSVEIGTLNFIMEVGKDVLANGIPSQSVIEDLDALVAEAVGDNYYNKTEIDNLNSLANIIGNSKEHRVVAGCIRNSGNGWEFIVDENHQADLNCLSVGIQNGRLFIDYSGINAKKVISLLVAPDETFASLGYLVGASVGKTRAYIQVFKNTLKSVSAQIKATAGSIGLDTGSTPRGVTSAEWSSDNNRLVIRHDTVSSDIPNISLTNYLYGRCFMHVFSQSGTTTQIEFYSEDGTKKTVPDSTMSFIFNRWDKDVTMQEIDTSTLVSLNGNFWFIGIFEV